MANETNLRATNLYDGDRCVTTIEAPYDPPVDAIYWVNRIYIRKPDGRYVESTLWVSTEAPF